MDKMGKTLKIIYFVLLSFVLIGSLAFAANYEYLHNPFTGRQDRSLSLNQTNNNFTVDYINVNGSHISDVCFSNGSNCDPNMDTNESARFTNLTLSNCPGTTKATGVSANGSLICGTDLTTTAEIHNQAVNTTSNVTFFIVNVSSLNVVATNLTEFQLRNYAANDTDDFADTFTTYTNLSDNNVTLITYILSNNGTINTYISSNNITVISFIAGNNATQDTKWVANNVTVTTYVDSKQSGFNSTSNSSINLLNATTLNLINTNLTQAQIDHFAANSTEQIQDSAWAAVTGGTETLITVTYQDAADNVDFVVTATLSSYTNDALFAANLSDARFARLNVTTQLGLEGNQITDVLNITFSTNRTHHQIHSNITCTIIEGSTSSLIIC